MKACQGEPRGPRRDSSHRPTWRRPACTGPEERSFPLLLLIFTNVYVWVCACCMCLCVFYTGILDLQTKVTFLVSVSAETQSCSSSPWGYRVFGVLSKEASHAVGFLGGAQDKDLNWVREDLSDSSEAAWRLQLLDRCLEERRVVCTPQSLQQHCVFSPMKRAPSIL